MLKYRIIKVINIMLVTFLFTQTIKAQSIGVGSSDDCGTWKEKPVYYTEWQAVDTIKCRHVKDTVRSWVYDEEKLIHSNQAFAVYCPCGCANEIKWQQYRVCEITGIRQVRYKIQSYEYKPKPKSHYEKVVDSLNKN